MARLADNVRAAVKCGPIPKLRDFQTLPLERLTRGERVCRFITEYLKVPEGALVGQPVQLAPFQQAFIVAVYDNPKGTRKAFLSCARKNSKTTTIAMLLLAHIIGPEAKQNTQIASAAASREQAALVFHAAEKMINQSTELRQLTRIVPSGKRIIGLTRNVEYKALSAEAGTALGMSLALAICDELGIVRGPSSPFIDAITTSQGAHENPLLIGISTQAPSDADMLSVWLDDAERSQDPHTISHLYQADSGADLLDKKQWRKANPALGLFRLEKDLEEQLKQAARLPSMEASARNLLLNQRISLINLFLAPAAWKANSAKPDIGVFRNNKVSMGLDLSARQDLTAAVLAAKDEDGVVHLLPFVYTPQAGLEERALRDRTPYAAWVRDGYMIAVPGTTIDYDWLAADLSKRLKDLDIRVHTIEFDRWRWELFQKAADEAGLRFDVINPVGQGYKDMSPRLEAFESLLLQGKIRHGAHPLLNMSAANAIATFDPAGNRKLDKSKTTSRIDPLVASVMACYAVGEGQARAVQFDVRAVIGSLACCAIGLALL